MSQRKSEQLDPESLVARMIAELRANPTAQRLLLRALLTNEFLGMPARLDRIESDIVELKADVSQLKTDVSQLKTDVRQLKGDVHQLKNDVGSLKGSDLEMRVHRRIRPLLSQHLQLRRARIVSSALHQDVAEFDDPVADAAEAGRISPEQEHRIIATDIIVHAQRRLERTPVWVAVEVAGRVDGDDIRRSRESADTLATVFGEEALPVVAGYRIDGPDRNRAAAAGVRYLEVPERP